MATIAGIDLGTSTSEIAIFAHGKPLVLPLDEEGPVIPSAVWESPRGELVTGRHAYLQIDAIKEFKRDMGLGHRYQLGARSLSPEECSALLLKYLVSRAQERLHEEIDRAVITVPASWGDGPRRATEEAGRIAGLQVERLINEPTAAALAFGVRPDADGKTIMVYDFGGGTFDVTILRIKDGVFEVVTSVGDGHLGGTDIDDLLLRHTLEHVAEETGYRHHLRQDKRLDWELKLACEAAKKELSLGERGRIALDFLGTHQGRPVGVELELARAAFEHLIEPLVARSLVHLEAALRRAKLPRNAIDEIVLIGGSTRIPLIGRRVAEALGKAPRAFDVHPEEAVALGAAIQAAVLSGSADGQQLILDRTSHGLGVETLVTINDEPVTGVFSKVIEKDVLLPAEGLGHYTTVVDNQRRLEVKCFQGNAKWVSQNAPLGEPIVVDGLPPRPAGEVSIEISFKLGLSDLLDVDIRIAGEDLAASRRFDLTAARFGGAERERRQDQLNTLWQRSELARKYWPVIEQAETKLSSPLPGTARSTLAQALSRLQQAIVNHDPGAAESAEDELNDALFGVEGP